MKKKTQVQNTPQLKNAHAHADTHTHTRIRPSFGIYISIWGYSSFCKGTVHVSILESTSLLAL
jgi:hypothetical protein